MRALLDNLYRWSGALAAAFIVAICLVVAAQVMLNLIDRLATLFTGGAIGLTIPSYSDFTGFFLAAASFLALAYTLRAGGHIRVSLLLQHLPPRARRLAEFWSVGLAALTSGYFAWYTARLTYESFIYNDLSPGMVAVPIWIPQAAMLVGLAVLTIALVDEFVGLCRGREPSYAGKDEDLLGDSGGQERPS